MGTGRSLAIVLLAALLAGAWPARAYEPSCSDGLDEDGDGATDCADRDCVWDRACDAEDYDGDGVDNRTDCAPMDPVAWTRPDVPVTGLRVAHVRGWNVRLTWDDATGALGATTRYDVAYGALSRLWRERSTVPGAFPVAVSLTVPVLADSSPILRPPGQAPSDGYWYLVRANDACGMGPWENDGLDPWAPWDEAGLQCGDGLDNDGNTLADCADPKCSNWGCPENCADGFDNDGDHLADCNDPDCTNDPSCGEDCANGVDDDADTLIDCADSECFGPTCPEACTGGLDEDGDTLADCADPDCASPACPELCLDGFDNDADTLVDCADPDCSALPACCPDCARPELQLPDPTVAYQFHADSLVLPCTDDWFTLQLNWGDTIELATCSPGAANFDSILELRGPACAVVSSNDDNCGLQSRLTYNVTQAGLYRVHVMAWGGGGGSYTLAYRIYTTCQTCTAPDSVVRNPTLECATIAESTDATCRSRFYQMALTAGRTYQFKTSWYSICGDTACVGAASYDTTLTLYNPSCTQVAFNDDCGGIPSYLRYTPATTGTYRLGVSGWGSNHGSFTLAYLREGCSSCFESMRSLAAPTPLCQSVDGSVTSTCGETWYDLPVTAGVAVELATCDTGCGGSASFDTLLEIFTDSCAPETVSDTACAPLSNILYTPTFTGYAHVRVSGRSGGTGTFRLTWRTP